MLHFSFQLSPYLCITLSVGARLTSPRGLVNRAPTDSVTKTVEIERVEKFQLRPPLNTDRNSTIDKPAR
jgi:hypothetical protein